MIGIYYRTDLTRIRAASNAFGEAVEEVARWLGESRWLAGDSVTLSEAIMIAVYVRFDGLRRLGLEAALPTVIEDHRQRCMLLPGWKAVEWAGSQTDEFVRRFTKYRARSAAAAFSSALYCLGC